MFPHLDILGKSHLLFVLSLELCVNFSPFTY